MKNLVIILMLAFCCNCLADNNQPAHVIITAGQSNTDGRVPNDRLPDYIKAMSTDTAFTTGAYKYCKIAQNRTDGEVPSFLAEEQKKSQAPHMGI